MLRHGAALLLRDSGGLVKSSFSMPPSMAALARCWRNAPVGMVGGVAIKPCVEFWHAWYPASERST